MAKLAIGEQVRFDEALGEVVAITAALDANGRGSISYGSGSFQFRVLKEQATPTPLVTNGADAYLRVGLLQNEEDATLFALVFDDPYWGRLVGGSKSTWYEASQFAGQDSVVFVAGWAPGTLRVKKGGVAESGVYVDFVLTYSTDDGEHESWWQPAFPWAGLGSNRGCFETDALGVVSWVDPDGTPRPIIFPRGLGARGHRETDTWPGGPEAERILTSVRMYYLQESAVVTEGADTEIDVAAVSLTINGPPNAEYKVFVWDAWHFANDVLDGTGTATVTGLPPGKHSAVLYGTTTTGLPRQYVDCPESGGSYTVNFTTSWTTVPANKWQGAVYLYGAEPYAGATLWEWYEFGPGEGEYRVWATCDGNGEFGPLDPPSGAGELVVEHPDYGAAAVNPQRFGTLWWGPCLGAYVAAIPSQEIGIEEQGIAPWGTDGGHLNLPSPELTGYLKDDDNGVDYVLSPMANGIRTTTALPRWFLNADRTVPASDATRTFSLFDADGTDTGTDIQLVADEAAPDVGIQWWENYTEGNWLKEDFGGKINGAVVQASRSSTIDGGLPEPCRYGVEFGTDITPSEVRTHSASADERSLTFVARECPYCGGPVWQEPNDGTYTRWACMECGVDARGYFATRTESAVDDVVVAVVHNLNTGMCLRRAVSGHPRPEDYDETNGYLVAGWNGGPYSRWVAKHVTLGTLEGGAFTDGESVADAELRTGRTIGPVMLKLELQADYHGSGKTVEVTATDVAGHSRTLAAIVPPGSAAGIRIPLDWHAHESYPRGYYTDVTAASEVSGDGYLHTTIVNDGPAWHSTVGVNVSSHAYTPWACDVALSSREPFLREDAAGRTHLVYLQDGHVMHRIVGPNLGIGGATNVTLRAGVSRSHTKPSVVPKEDGRLLVCATRGEAGRLYRSLMDGDDWVAGTE